MAWRSIARAGSCTSPTWPITGSGSSTSPTGTIATFAGTGQGKHAGDGGPATAASIAGARAVEVAPDGTVLILERQGNTLRAVDPTTGTITTRAGTGAKGYSGDGGPATAATFNGPKELAVDAAGNVFIVDTENHAIRRIDAQTGTISTVAGSGRRGGQGDGGPATSAELDRPHGVAVAPDGALYIGDTDESPRAPRLALNGIANQGGDDGESGGAPERRARLDDGAGRGKGGGVRALCPDDPLRPEARRRARRGAQGRRGARRGPARRAGRSTSVPSAAAP